MPNYEVFKIDWNAGLSSFDFMKLFVNEIRILSPEDFFYGCSQFGSDSVAWD